MAVDTRTDRLHFLALVREAVGIAYLSLPRIVTISAGWSLLAITLVLAAPATAVVVAAADATIADETFGIWDAIRSFQHYFWRSQAVFVPIIVLADIAGWLWLHAQSTGNSATFVGAFLAFDGLLLVGFLLLYYFPLLVRHDRSARATARRSAEFVVKQVTASVGLALLLISVATLLAFTVAGFVLLAPGFTATVLALGMRYLEGEISQG